MQENELQMSEYPRLPGTPMAGRLVCVPALRARIADSLNQFSFNSCELHANSLTLLADFNIRLKEH